MASAIIRTLVSTRFALTKREKADRKIRDELRLYLEIADALDPEVGAREVEVPSMLGVDDDMRRWSFFMILEHNVIVNRRVTSAIKRLANDEPPAEDAKYFDVKKDVMPSASPGIEQVAAFRESVEEHLEKVAALPKLKGTATSPHSIFGPFDAHKWHCMFGFHLEIHRKQAEAVMRLLHDDN
ncbi:DinB family protein [Arenicella sp.]|nr:DinB family protein [Arenicella sp.]